MLKKKFRRTFVFLVLASLKTLGHLFYTFSISYDKQHTIDWRKIKLIAFINHTSLFDLLLVCVFPYSFLWEAAERTMTPIAEKTLKRPFVGLIFKNLNAKQFSVSQKRDSSWDSFLNAIDHQSIVALFPEGRMARKNGLDKHGNPMTIKSGIVDILQKQNDGCMLLVHSQGMHHIQSPGQQIPRIFQKITIALETLTIESYKQQHDKKSFQDFSKSIIADLSKRKDDHQKSFLNKKRTPTAFPTSPRV